MKPKKERRAIWGGREHYPAKQKQTADSIEQADDAELADLAGDLLNKHGYLAYLIATQGMSATGISAPTIRKLVKEIDVIMAVENLNVDWFGRVTGIMGSEN